MKQKVITCASYYCSGSSAVTDLLQECSNIECKGDQEIRFLHDPYGVSDLEYHVVTAPNRHNSSHAVNKFLYHMKFLSKVGPIQRYEKYFDNQFWNSTKTYIDNLVTCSYSSRWHFDIYEKGKFYYVIFQIINKIVDQFYKKVLHQKYSPGIKLSKKDVAYVIDVSEEKFINETRKYVNELITILNPHKKEFVMCDQLVPSSNISHHMRYIYDIKTIVVDRDPRDVYIYTNFVEKGTIVPKDVNKFCQWFKWTRKMSDNDRNNPNIYFLKLEDLIYDYDITKRKIFDFLGISEDNHVYKKKYFNPEISKLKNKFWEKYPQYQNEIKIIEKELSEYIYEFPE